MYGTSNTTTLHLQSMYRLKFEKKCTNFEAVLLTSNLALLCLAPHMWKGCNFIAPLTLKQQFIFKLFSNFESIVCQELYYHYSKTFFFAKKKLTYSYVEWCRPFWKCISRFNIGIRYAFLSSKIVILMLHTLLTQMGKGLKYKYLNKALTEHFH